MTHTTTDNTVTIILDGRIDSNNAPQVEKEILSLIKECDGKEISFDAKDLEYISSAGLRVLLKAQKTQKKPIQIINVSRDVYDIFETTGFSELFDVKKRLREISIDGCELIGRGATASVYRIDKETIVKVFNENVDSIMALRENEKAKAAFLAGIPTAISYDLVKVGNCLGTVFELLDAETLQSVIENDKEHIAEHIAGFAREIRSLHQIEVDPEHFTDTRKQSLAYINKLTGILTTAEETEALAEMYKIVPERRTFIHGDCHTGNVMIQNGEFMFIDLSSGGMGHPVFDLTSMALIYKFPSMNPDFEEGKKHNMYISHFSREEVLLIWDTYLRTYFEGRDDEFIAKAERQILAYAALRLLFAGVAIPGLIPEQRLQTMKNIALRYCQHIEPLCF